MKGIKPMTKTKTQKKAIKKRKRARRVLLLLLLVAAIISICLFTPFFNVQNVEVTGNSTITSEQIIAQASIPKETNIFRIHKGKLKKSLLSIPEVEEVKIKRRLPATVVLRVKETPAVMFAPYMTGYVTMSSSGRAIALCDDKTDLNLIELTGLEIKNAEICKKISVQDRVKFDIILDAIRILQDKGLLGEVRSCHFDNLSDFHVYLTDGTKIIFGETEDLAYKISVLDTVLPMVNRTEGVYVDLTTPSRAFYGTLPQPEEEPEATEEGQTSEESQDENSNETGESKKEESQASPAPSASPSAEE